MLATRAGAQPVPDTRAWFFVAFAAAGQAGWFYREHRPDFRLEASAANADLVDNAKKVDEFLGARPVYAKSIASAAAIADVEVVAYIPGAGGHCTSPGGSAEVKLLRVLCGQADATTTITIPLHQVCAGRSQGPAPRLVAGQHAVLVLRRDQNDWPAGATVLRDPGDVFPADRWEELAALRKSADR